jgi:hypothetical protein
MNDGKPVTLWRCPNCGTVEMITSQTRRYCGHTSACVTRTSRGISDQDRADLADLAMRALDTILEDYGEDADLCAASLVFEVSTKDDDGDPIYLQTTANYLMEPTDG